MLADALIDESQELADPAPDRARGIARAMLAFEQRDWRSGCRLPAERLGVPADLLDLLPGDAARERVVQAYFRHWRGDDVPAQAFDTPVGRWAVLPVAALERRLCALALVRRPGVLRSCVARGPRNEMAALLKGAFEPLRAESLRTAGRPVSPDYAGAGAAFWVQVGYLDLVAAKAWPHAALRRNVRAALVSQPWPRGARHDLRSSRPVPESIAAVEGLMREESSW